MDIDGALRRYLRNADVSRWLFSTEPVTTVTPRHLADCFVYSIGIGNTKLKMPSAMHVEEMLIMTSVSDTFIMGVLWGFGQPHIFSQTPMMRNSRPVARRFAIDLSQTDALEFMEFDIFHDGKIIVAFRRFLHTRDSALPCLVNISLHDASNVRGTLGPIRMRARLLEATSCPSCGKIGNACFCHFLDPNYAPFAPTKRQARDWIHFTSLFQHKAHLGIVRLNISAVFPDVGDVQIQTQTFPVMNLLQRGSTDYLNFLRRKAVHEMGINVIMPRADTVLSNSLPTTATSSPALSSEPPSLPVGFNVSDYAQHTTDTAASLAVSTSAYDGTDNYDVGRGGTILPPSRPLGHLPPTAPATIITAPPKLKDGLPSTMATTVANVQPSSGCTLHTQTGTKGPDSVFSGDNMFSTFPPPESADLVTNVSHPCKSELTASNVNTNRIMVSSAAITAKITANANAPPLNYLKKTQNMGDAVTAFVNAALQPGHKEKPKLPEIPVPPPPPASSSHVSDVLLNELSTSTPTFDMSTICPPSVCTMQPVTPRTAHEHATILQDIEQIISTSSSSTTSKNSAQQHQPSQQGGRDSMLTTNGDITTTTGLMTAKPEQLELSAAPNTNAMKNDNTGNTIVGSSSRISPNVSSHSRPRKMDGAVTLPSTKNPNNVSSLEPTDILPVATLAAVAAHATSAKREERKKLGKRRMRRRPSLPSYTATSGERKVDANNASTAKASLGNGSAASVSTPLARSDAMNTATMPTKEANNIPSEGGEDGERKHACKQCTSRFKMRGDLLRHVKIVHEGKKMYTCQFCKKKFGHSGHLNRHVQSVHLQQRRFKCHLCGFQFYQASHLQSHINHIHNEDRKMFPCKSCGVQLKSQTALRNHVAKCHSIDNVQDVKRNRSEPNVGVTANSENVFSLTCSFPGCTARFSDLNDLKLHITVTHLQHTSQPASTPFSMDMHVLPSRAA